MDICMKTDECDRPYLIISTQALFINKQMRTLRRIFLRMHCDQILFQFIIFNIMYLKNLLIYFRNSNNNYNLDNYNNKRL